MAILEDGSYLDRELFPASVAFIETDPVVLALESAGLIDHAAMWADTPISPQASLNKSVGGALVIEMRSGKNGPSHGKISLMPPPYIMGLVPSSIISPFIFPNRAFSMGCGR